MFQSRVVCSLVFRRFRLRDKRDGKNTGGTLGVPYMFCLKLSRSTAVQFLGKDTDGHSLNLSIPLQLQWHPGVSHLHLEWHPQGISCLVPCVLCSPLCLPTSVGWGKGVFSCRGWHPTISSIVDSFLRWTEADVQNFAKGDCCVCRIAAENTVGPCILNSVGAISETDKTGGDTSE